MHVISTCVLNYYYKLILTSAPSCISLEHRISLPVHAATCNGCIPLDDSIDNMSMLYSSKHWTVCEDPLTQDQCIGEKPSVKVSRERVVVNKGLQP